MLPKMSRAGRWARCTASVYLESQWPDTQNDSAKEGLEKHQEGANCLRNNTVSGDTDLDTYIESCKFAAQYAGSWGIETEVVLLDLRGYVDFWAYMQNSKTLLVADLKWGLQRVGEVENWQLLCYAIALSKQFPDAERFVLRIVQPRSWAKPAIRDWTIDRPALDEYSLRIERAVHSIKHGHTVTTPGPQCTNCKALLSCRGHDEAVMRAFEIALADLDFDITAEEAEYRYSLLEKAKEVITQKFDTFDKFLLESAKSGKLKLSAYELSTARGKTRWRDSEEVIRTGDSVGINLRKPAQPVSISEAKSLGLSDFVTQLLTEVPPGAPRLVKRDHEKYLKLFNKEN